MVIKVGHRGVRGYVSENTLASFKRAITLKVDMIELDVHKCKTGEIVVIHDFNVERVTDGNGKIVDLSYSQIKNLHIDKKHKIPLLKDVFNLVERRVKINIEIKDYSMFKDVVDNIHNYIKKGWKYSDFVVSSFKHRELFGVIKLDPKIRTGFLYDESISKKIIKGVNDAGAYSINLNHNKIDKKVVNYAHNLGLKVFVWTVNSKEDIKEMKKLGVDMICSDYPDRI